MKEFDKLVMSQEKLGEGSSSEVFAGFDKVSKKPLAFKKAQVAKIQLEDWDREVSILQRLSSEENTVRLVDVIYQQEQDFVVMVMERVQGLNFLQLLEQATLDEKHTKLLFYKLVRAVHSCHERGVVHLDVKLENAMYDFEKEKVVLVDFGFSRIYDRADPVTINQRGGSEGYCAPEVFVSGLKYDGRKVDVFALGVLLYTLLYRKFPFKSAGAASLEVWKKRYSEVLFTLVNEHRSSSQLFDLFKKLLNPRPNHRPLTEEILRHPWFTSSESFSSHQKK